MVIKLLMLFIIVWKISVQSDEIEKLLHSLPYRMRVVFSQVTLEKSKIMNE